MKSNILVLTLLMLGCQLVSLPTATPPTLAPNTCSICYVTPEGSDTNPGTQAQPWKTIQKAANTLAPGQTVNVAAGTYNEQVSVTRSGTSGSLIAFQANGKVVIKGFKANANYVSISDFEITDPSSTSNGWGIHLTGSNNLIQNNYIHDMPWGGILLYANVANPTLSSQDTVQNNTIYHVGQVGIDVRGRNNTVQYNDISATVQYFPGVANPPSWVDADGIHFHGQGHILRGNKIHDILYTQPGNTDPHIDCFQTFAFAPSQEVASNILIDGNYCNEMTGSTTYGLAAKAFQVEGGAYNLTFRNNIVITLLSAIFTDSHDVMIVNNTFVDDPNEPNSQGIYLNNSPHVTVQNNIFAYQQNGVGSIWPDSTSNASLTAGYNCVYRKDGNPQRPADPGDVWGLNPLFANEISGDYHLQSGSPCIDKGINLGSGLDFDGEVRPQGNGFDMGAYEYQGP